MSKRNAKISKFTPFVFCIVFLVISNFWGESKKIGQLQLLQQLSGSVLDSIVTGTNGERNDSSVSNLAQKIVYLNESQPSIYFCQGDGNGVGEAKAVLKSALPDYNFQDMQRVGEARLAGRAQRRWEKKPGNEFDVFVLANRILCSNVVMQWLLHTYAGKLVYVSGESEEHFGIQHDNVYVLGPVPKDTDNALTLYYLQMVWWKVFRKSPTDDKLLTNITKKPKNSGEHFLIYSASNCVGFREAAFDSLSKIGPVHYGGKCSGTSKDFTNKTKYVNPVGLGNFWDNVKEYNSFRFCLIMEHVKQDGYITEKILMAFLAGCVPIYYGTTSIFDIFNQHSFIYYDVTDPNPSLQYIQHLESNKTAYAQLMAQPILAQGAFEKYFSFSDDAGGGVLKKKIRKKLGLDHIKFV